MSFDPYAILEIEPTASESEIREAYHLLIHAWHPDRFPEGSRREKATARMADINSAYEALKSRSQRASYQEQTRQKTAASSDQRRQDTKGRGNENTRKGPTENTRREDEDSQPNTQDQNWRPSGPKENSSYTGYTKFQRKIRTRSILLGAVRNIVYFARYPIALIINYLYLTISKAKIFSGRPIDYDPISYAMFTAASPFMHGGSSVGCLGNLLIIVMVIVLFVLHLAIALLLWIPIAFVIRLLASRIK